MSDEQDVDQYECAGCQASVNEDDTICPDCGTDLIGGEDMDSIYFESSSGLGCLIAFVIVVALIMLVAKGLGTF